MEAGMCGPASRIADPDCKRVEQGSWNDQIWNSRWPYASRPQRASDGPAYDWLLREWDPSGGPDIRGRVPQDIISRLTLVNRPLFSCHGDATSV